MFSDKKIFSSFLYRENKPRPLAAMFFDKLDGLNNLSKGSPRKYFCQVIPGVSLTLCCFVVYSTRQFVVCLSVCHFVLVFFSPFSIAIISLREERES